MIQRQIVFISLSLVAGLFLITALSTSSTSISQQSEAQVSDHKCPEEARKGDYNCDGQVNSSDYDKYTSDLALANTELIPFFEWIRKGIFGEYVPDPTETPVPQEDLTPTPTLPPGEEPDPTATPTPSPTSTSTPTPSPTPELTEKVTETGIDVLVIDANPRLTGETGTLRNKYEFMDPLHIFQFVRDELRPYIHVTIADVERYNTFLPIEGESASQVEAKVLGCMQNVTGDNPNCDENWQIDYPAFFEDLDICERVNNGEIDEIWLGSYPYGGSGEDDMVGPNPYFINGHVVVYTACNKNVPVLSADYNRPGRFGSYNTDLAVASTLHSLSHRVESTMKKVYGSWSNYPNLRQHHWDFFAYSPRNSVASGTVYGCGNTHFPPNAVADYEYGESRTARSYCSTYVENFPDRPDIQSQATVSCSEWGCNELGYMQWWYDKLPAEDGVGSDGRLLNWYEYVFNPAKTIADSRELNGLTLGFIEVQPTYDPIDHVEHYYHD